MNRKVINRKNIVIAHDFTGATVAKFQSNIYLQFQPDTMNVKLINTSGGENIVAFKERNTSLIYCQNINEYIGSFWDGTTSTPNLTFDVKNQTFNTAWLFESRKVDGTVDTTSTCSIAIHLEFLQHEEK